MAGQDVRGTDEARQAGAKLLRHRIRDWHGLVPAGNRRQRVLLFGVLLVITVLMTFEQLGFIGVGFDGSYSAYVLALLAPLCATTLLLGRGWGAIMGVSAGVIQYVHALLQPLDLYEKYFVTLPTSVLIYLSAAVVLGLAFSIALRNDPKGIRRYLYIAFSCLVAAIVTALVFFVSIMFVTLMVAASQYVEGSEVFVSTSMMQAIGGVATSFHFHMEFLLMLAVAIACDKVMAYQLAHTGLWSLRVSFRARLVCGVLMTFLVVAGASFVAITIQAEAACRAELTEEVDYILQQIGMRTESESVVTTVPEYEGLSAASKEAIRDALALDDVLSGYTLEEDGTMVVFADVDGTLKVVASDNPGYAEGMTAEVVFGANGSDRLRGLAASGEMSQMVYDVQEGEAVYMSVGETGGKADVSITGNDEVTYATTQIGYMVLGEANGYVVMAASPSSKVFAERQVTITSITLTTFVLLLVVYFFVWRLLGTLVVTPIDETNGSLARICEGDLEERVEQRTNTEFSELSDGINATVDALKGLIAEAEQRMEGDLQTAKTIQSSALPSTFPPFPEIEAFDIFASMNPAKEVGGDFYDFFLVDDHTLGFLIADVSGKGIPGALFMMAAKAELQNFMATGMSLSQAVVGANEHLCDGNDAGMFVTVWAATLDYTTGLLTYVNAGHNPPLLRHDGKWEWLKKKGGLFLGTFERAKYREATLTLEVGDELFLYTDGVNEAFSAQEEEYGNDRLEAFLTDHAELHPIELVHAMAADVAQWAEGAEQSDDITMVALEFGRAPDVTGTITVPAEHAYLERAAELIDGELDRRLCPPQVRNRVVVALEELFVNVCNYAYEDADAPGDVEVSYVYRADPSSITVQLRDWGCPFDPARKEDPTKPASVAEMPVGGLGIMMVKRAVDEFYYAYEDGANVTVFKKGW